jgi:hypothetical protein
MRVVAGVVLACLVLGGATACGENRRRSEQAQEAAQKQGDQIQKRLERRYTVGGLAQVENLTPAPEQAYTVKVDFASPRSFTLTVLVFRSPAPHGGSSGARAAVPHHPAVQAAARRGLGRVVGPVVYSGLIDSAAGKLAQDRFDRIVSIAEGTG